MKAVSGNTKKVVSHWEITYLRLIFTSRVEALIEFETRNWKTIYWRSISFVLPVNTRTRCETCSELTIKKQELHQLTFLRCLYCRLHTHFTTCVVFVLLTLNTQLCAQQLPSFREDMWEMLREIAMWNCS